MRLHKAIATTLTFVLSAAILATAQPAAATNSIDALGNLILVAPQITNGYGGLKWGDAPVNHEGWICQESKIDQVTKFEDRCNLSCTEPQSLGYVGPYKISTTSYCFGDKGLRSVELSLIPSVVETTDKAPQLVFYLTGEVSLRFLTSKANKATLEIEYLASRGLSEKVGLALEHLRAAAEPIPFREQLALDCEPCSKVIADVESELQKTFSKSGVVHLLENGYMAYFMLPAWVDDGAGSARYKKSIIYFTQDRVFEKDDFQN